MEIIIMTIFICSEIHHFPIEGVQNTVVCNDTNIVTLEIVQENNTIDEITE